MILLTLCNNISMKHVIKCLNELNYLNTNNAGNSAFFNRTFPFIEMID